MIEDKKAALENRENPRQKEIEMCDSLIAFC